MRRRMRKRLFLAGFRKRRLNRIRRGGIRL